MLLLRSTDSNLWRQARALLTLVSSLHGPEDGLRLLVLQGEVVFDRFFEFWDAT